MSKPPHDSKPHYNPYAQPQSQPQPNYSPYHEPHLPPVSPLAVTSLVTGIISLTTSCCACVAIPLALVAVVCGVTGISQCNSGRYTGRGMAVAGTICGSIGLLVVIGLIVVRVILGTATSPPFNLPKFNDV